MPVKKWLLPARWQSKQTSQGDCLYGSIFLIKECQRGKNLTILFEKRKPIWPT